jgi:SAM-dependent methyltransferase
MALPFEDRHFDLAWTQHVAMNIANRAQLYAEVHRVLRPGGRFAIYDVVAGETEPLIFPVPWSREPETSFLLTPAAMRATRRREGPHRFTQKQPPTFASALLSVATVETPKNQLSRDFGRSSIFDFFNSIRQKQSF